MHRLLMMAAASGIAGVLAAGCLGGVSEGDSCGGPQDDCASNLTCQPIQGRSASYCCPTPPETSKEDNCHAVTH